MPVFSKNLAVDTCSGTSFRNPLSTLAVQAAVHCMRKIVSCHLKQATARQVKWRVRR